jgi:hypothetical protein
VAVRPNPISAPAGVEAPEPPLATASGVIPVITPPLIVGEVRVLFVRVEVVALSAITKAVVAS